MTMQPKKPSQYVAEMHSAVIVNGSHNRPKAKQLADGRGQTHMTIRGAAERLEDAARVSRLLDATDEDYYADLMRDGR